jgi:hypothetical protein
MKNFLRLLGFLAFTSLILGLINLLAAGNESVTKWLYGIGAALLLAVLVWPEQKSRAPWHNPTITELDSKTGAPKDQP